MVNAIQKPFSRMTKISNSYGTAQFKLYTRVQVHACVAALTRAKFQELVCVHALLHAIYVCTCGKANTHNTREMHVTSLHLVCHTTCVV